MTYLTDVVRIITCETDKHGVLTETEGSDIDARIKDYNRLVMDNKGQEVVGAMSVIISKGNAVSYGDKIKIRKRWGVDNELKDKKFVIKKIEGIGGFSQDLIRVII